MKFGICPQCNSKVSIKLFKVTCESCSIELKDSPGTSALKIAISVGTLLVAIYVDYDGTAAVIEQSAGDAKDALYWFYLKIFVAALVISHLINFVIHQFFSVYEQR